MFDPSEKLRLEKLLSDTIPLLCKNSLGCQLALNVEALIGITIGDGASGNGQVFMVSFKQAISAGGSLKSYAWMEQSISPESHPSIADSGSNCIEQSFNTKTDTAWTERSGQETDAIRTAGWLNVNTWPENHSTHEKLVCSSRHIRRRAHQDDLTENHTVTDLSDINNAIKVEDDCDEDTDLQAHFDQSDSANCVQEWCCGYDEPEHVARVADSNNFGSKLRCRVSGKAAPRSRGKWLSSSTKNAKVSAKYHHFQSVDSVSARAAKWRLGNLRPSATVSEQQQWEPQIVQLSETSEPGATCSSLESAHHKPSVIPPTARKLKPQKRCRVCYMAKVRRGVRFCCRQCPDQPGLCVEPCFQLYHGMIGVPPDKIYTGLVSSEDGGPTCART